MAIIGTIGSFIGGLILVAIFIAIFIVSANFFGKIFDITVDALIKIFGISLVAIPFLVIAAFNFYWAIQFNIYDGFFTDAHRFHWSLFAGLAALVFVPSFIKKKTPTLAPRVLGLIFTTLAVTNLFGSLAFNLGLESLLIDRETGIPVIQSYFGAFLYIVFSFIPFSMFGMIIITMLIAILVAIVGGIYAFFTFIPLYVFDTILDFEHSVAFLKFKKRQASIASSRALSLILGLEHKPILPDDSKGAREATIDEIVKVYVPTDPKAMAFGHIGQPLFLKTEKHILIMASTRSGKGATLIIPHLLTYAGSAFVLDPKGENARVTGRHRATLNSKVHYLDPFGISGKPKSRFNPMARMTRENMEAESKALAAALFVSGGKEHDFWDMSGQQLVAAIILYVFLSEKIKKEEKDLRRVRQILLSGLDDALADMQADTTIANGLLFDLSSSFINTEDREKSSVISTATRQTAILDNPYIAECVSASGQGEEVNFTDWRTGTMTVYLCLSAPKFPVFNRWLRLVLTSALDEMTDSMGPPPLPVCFMLDELATLGHLESVENAVGLAAGYGIQLVTVFQDVAQMRDLYKGRWASFISNSGIRAVFNLDDYDTAKYWSDFMGGRLVETTSKNIDLLGYSKGENQSEAMRPLYAPDEIMYKFASGKMLVLMQGQKPIISDRVFYKHDTRLNGLWDEPI